MPVLHRPVAGVVRRAGDRLTSQAVRRLVHRTLTGRLRDSRDVLRGRLTRADVDAIWADTTETYATLARDLPSEPTVGSRLAVRLAAWTLALDRALQAHGTPAADAHALTSDVAWAAYRPAVMVKSFPARVLIRDRRARLAAHLRAQQRFPFNAPGWHGEPVGTDGLAIDMTRCPIAAYLRSRGGADVCVAAWCAQDGPVAELWGARLERIGTLAAGADVCDFRYAVATDR